jgi:hypothetical protein
MSLNHWLILSPGTDGPPQAVVRGMTSLLEALAELDEDRPAAIPRSRP